MNTYTPRHYSSILPMTLGALPAAVVTALLVMLMHSLIASDTPYVEEESTIVAPLVMSDPKPIELRTIQPPVAPVSAETPPKTHRRVFENNPEIDQRMGEFIAPVPEGGPGIVIGVGGGGIVAYLKPQPVYPSRAISRGIEGHVDLAFDIIASGATTNIRVIDAHPANVFERAAISALKKWKYKVPVIDGVSKGQVDMMTRMTFEVDG